MFKVPLCTWGASIEYQMDAFRSSTFFEGRAGVKTTDINKQTCRDLLNSLMWNANQQFKPSAAKTVSFFKQHYIKRLEGIYDTESISSSIDEISFNNALLEMYDDVMESGSVGDVTRDDPPPLHEPMEHDCNTSESSISIPHPYVAVSLFPLHPFENELTEIYNSVKFSIGHSPKSRKVAFYNCTYTLIGGERIRGSATMLERCIEILNQFGQHWRTAVELRPT